MCSVITEISCHCIDLFLKTGIVKYTFVHMAGHTGDVMA